MQAMDPRRVVLLRTYVRQRTVDQFSFLGTGDAFREGDAEG
jgi:hypothetical protein